MARHSSICMPLLLLAVACFASSSSINSNCPKKSSIAARTMPLNIAHRGSCGRLPEHSLPAYQTAIDEGADVIECDLCLTRDLRLVCSHEAWLSDTTNIADVFPEERMNTYLVITAGRRITDYFTVDFTWEELSLVRKRQRYSYRDQMHNDLYPLVTLEELIETVQAAGRPVGLHLETKDPTWVNSLEIVTNASTTFEDILLSVVNSYGYYDNTDYIFIQSFIGLSLQYLRPRTNITLVHLIGVGFQSSDEALERISQYADAIGPSRSLIVRTINDQIVERTDLVTRAHMLGLEVHTFTLKNENRHLPWDYGQDPYNEYADFVSMGVDGIFTDFPGTMSRYLESRDQCSQV